MSEPITMPTLLSSIGWSVTSRLALSAPSVTVAIKPIVNPATAHKATVNR